MCLQMDESEDALTQYVARDQERETTALTDAPKYGLWIDIAFQKHIRNARIPYELVVTVMYVS